MSSVCYSIGNPSIEYYQMLRIKRFFNGTFKTEFSNDAIDIPFMNQCMHETMSNFSFLIDRNSEISGDAFADLIISYSKHPNSLFYARFLRILNADNPEFVTMDDAGSIRFYGFSPQPSVPQDRLSQYFKLVKSKRLLSKDDLISSLSL